VKEGERRFSGKRLMFAFGPLALVLNGRYVRANVLKRKDPWGNLLEVSYTETRLSEKIEVRSLFRDAKRDTYDDIVESDSNMLPVKDIAAGVRRR
jgi:hypothetical protein